MRDYWNNAPEVDVEAVAAATIEVIKAAEPLTYWEMQELRNCSELCDRGHFGRMIEVLAAKSGAKAPAGLDVVLEDPDFDVRVSFMKAVVDAVDPMPAGVRAKRG